MGHLSKMAKEDSQAARTGKADPRTNPENAG
jgi:hypothetical protein